MKKKNILIILSIVLAICVGIGVYQAFTQKKVESTQAKTTIEATIEEATTSQNQITTEKANEEKADTGESKTTTKKEESQGKNQAQATTKSNSTTTAKATTTTTTTTQKQSVSVKVSITCKNIDRGDILSSTNVTMSQGDSAFDATKKICNSKGISLTYQSIYYIQGIGGVMEKDYGASSGWMYRVNGVSPNKSACSYTLNDGDVIEWYYVTSPSDR